LNGFVLICASVEEFRVARSFRSHLKQHDNTTKEYKRDKQVGSYKSTSWKSLNQKGSLGHLPYLQKLQYGLTILPQAACFMAGLHEHEWQEAQKSQWLPVLWLTGIILKRKI
jgi:hypothetical protein